MDSHPFCALFTVFAGAILAAKIRLIVISELSNLPRAVVVRWWWNRR